MDTVERRTITGMAAVLLPFDDGGGIDWAAFEAHVDRVQAAGLTPAVNMDTGYVQLLSEDQRLEVLRRTRATLGDGIAFVAGAYVADGPGDGYDGDAYARAATTVADHGATPVLFPSHGLNALDGGAWVEAQAKVGAAAGPFVGFELGDMFVPYGRIQSLETYRALLDVDTCIGAKHSSLDRQAEWDRLALRDAHRPDFKVLTGNDLAIDMVRYGSDYLLGLATFAPAEFAARDRAWAEGDEAGFLRWNDVLQYLGMFAFRDPVPAYRHDAALFLQLRGWSASDRTPPGAPRRSHVDAERDVLRDIAGRLDGLS